MNRTRNILNKHLLHAIFMGMLAILLLRAGGANVALALNCGQWNVIPTPSSGPSSQLDGVAAISANDVWAVGYSLSGMLQTLTEHWDGTQWSIIPSPNEQAGAELHAVAVVATNDVWAVGYYYDSMGFNHVLIEHWDGTQWSIVPNPNKDGFARSSALVGIVAVSANDVWAVGGNDTGSIIDQWDGKKWNIVSNPFPGFSGLTGVTALSANDIWVVGGYFNGSFVSFTWHWDGAQWSMVPSPNPGRCNGLQGIAGDATNDVWAVGAFHNTCGPHATASPFIEHWDGTQWQLASLSKHNATSETLYSVVASSPTDAWAVGQLLTTGKNKHNQTLIVQWNGTHWKVVSSPNPGQNNGLYGITTAGSGLWAVGYSDNGTLAEFYC